MARRTVRHDRRRRNARQAELENAVRASARARTPDAKLAETRTALLRWFDRSRRDLPWRRSSDPYRVWISEIMLQQTRVETVIPYYQRFLAAFPSVAALAAAPLEEVLRAWAGLGYYTRARNLHRAAGEIARAGAFPTTAVAWRTLPGIGRYTAAAIASIASGEAAAALDGNIERVLARFFAIRAPVNASRVKKQLWLLADELLDRSRPGDFNQALMELGATLCVPRQPMCSACPIRAGCRASHDGDAATLPTKTPARKPTALRRFSVAVWLGQRMLMVRRPPHGLFGGMWGLPGDSLSPGEAPIERIAVHLAARFGDRAIRCVPVGMVRHVLTHRVLSVEVFAARVRRAGRLGDAADARWVSETERAALPLSALDRKILAVAMRHEPLAVSAAAGRRSNRTADPPPRIDARR